jgi:hypothetical protein
VAAAGGRARAYRVSIEVDAAGGLVIGLLLEIVEHRVRDDAEAALERAVEAPTLLEKPLEHHRPRAVELAMRAARYHLAPLLTGGGCVWPPRPTAEPVAAYRPGGGGGAHPTTEGRTLNRALAAPSSFWPACPPRPPSAAAAAAAASRRSGAYGLQATQFLATRLRPSWMTTPGNFFLCCMTARLHACLPAGGREKFSAGGSSSSV